ncbi:MAG: DUF3108 domain-containing protein [Bacteriovoracia bacterium]
MAATGKTKNIRKAVILFLIISVCACVGRKIEITEQNDAGVPKELIQAFEITDSEAPAAPPEPTERADADHTDAHHKKKKAKKKKKITKKRVVKGFPIPYRRPNPDPVWVGEKIWMDVTWLGTTAGEFLLEVLPYKYIKGRKLYHIKGTARTTSIFSIIYKAEDWVETYVDYIGWFPYKFALHGDESRHIRDTIELFDHGGKRQYVYARDNRITNNEIVEEKGYKDLTPLSQDSLSALYYARTQSFDIGTRQKFPMTTGGSQWDTELVILEKEEIRTATGYMKAIKAKVETRFNGSLQQQGDSFIWFSDDPRHYIVRFEAKVKIGWISGILKKIEPGEPPQPDSPEDSKELAVAPQFDMPKQ